MQRSFWAERGVGGDGWWWGEIEGVRDGKKGQKKRRNTAIFVSVLEVQLLLGLLN